MGTSAIQGALWGAHAEDWANIAEPTTRPLWVAMQDAAGVGKGTRFLDLGCGAGGASELAASKGAEVAGIDASENLIEIARRRIPSGRFEVGDLEELPFESHAYDVVCAANSMQFVGDKANALAEVKRVKTGDGKFVIGMWAENEKCEMSAVFRAVMEVAQAPHSPEPSLSERDNLAALLESNGFSIVEEQEVECVFEFESAEKGWKGIRSAGMIVGAAQAVGEEPLREAIVGALKTFAKNDGQVRMSNWFRYMVAV